MRFPRAMIMSLAVAGLISTSCRRPQQSAPRSELFAPTSGMPAQSWTFPLKIDAGKRHLVDSHGSAFLIRGDAGWSSIVGLTNAEVRHYLTTRKNQGFNTIIINLIEHQFAGAANQKGAPFNRAGASPFQAPGDFAQPNEAYFQHADEVLKLAEELNLEVVLVPCYLGIAGRSEGWYTEVKKAGTDALRAYGEFLGKRYGAHPNLLWVAGGDRNPDDVRPQMDAMVAGFRKHAPNSLWMAHCGSENSGAKVYGDADWLAINTTYTYQAPSEYSLTEYARTPTRPNLFLETHYENDWAGRNAAETRRLAWLGALSGTCGHIFGNGAVWQFGKGWEQALYSDGTKFQMVIHRFLRSREWEKLVPETGPGLLVDGLGAGEDRRSAAVASNSSFAAVYLPKGGEVKIDANELGCENTKIWWLNPRDATSSNVGTFRANAVMTLRAPSTEDWVLVLDNAALPLDPPATVDIHPHL